MAEDSSGLSIIDPGESEYNATVTQTNAPMLFGEIRTVNSPIKKLNTNCKKKEPKQNQKQTSHTRYLTDARSQQHDATKRRK